MSKLLNIYLAALGDRLPGYPVRISCKLLGCCVLQITDSREGLAPPRLRTEERLLCHRNLFQIHKIQINQNPRSLFLNPPPCSSEAGVAVQLGLPQGLDALAVVLGENVPPQLGGGVRGRGVPVIIYQEVFYCGD